MRKLLAIVAIIAATPPLLAQQPSISTQRRAGPPTGPVPRLPNGRVDLNGLWVGGGPINDLESEGGLKKGGLDALLLPAARKMMASRDPGQDPYNYCMPGGPLRITGGFAWRFVQHPTVNSTHIFMLQEGNAHTYRQIFMNAKHPEDPRPTWYGHSIGRWDGDTLVIDTIGLNDRFWLDSGGTPHSEQLHLVERWTRTDFNTLRRDVTIEDPATFVKPFTVTYTAKLSEPGSEILEYICIENNQYGLPGGITNPAK